MTSNRTFSIAFLLCFLLAPHISSAEEFSGIAEVQSGSQVSVNGTVLRLFGLHTPDPDSRCDLSDGQYRCGIIAWAELIKLADGRDISCDYESDGKGGVPLATCYLGERDINEALVLSGWAEARADIERYQVDQAEARRARRGLWAERITPPDRRQAP
jgi:endonuclease YncB( thermonuclease family)